MKRPTFEQLAAFAHLHWGLGLRRGNPRDHGRWRGCWKTGFILEGNFPGCRFGSRRFRTLKQVARVLEYHRYAMEL